MPSNAKSEYQRALVDRIGLASGSRPGSLQSTRGRRGRCNRADACFGRSHDTGARAAAFASNVPGARRGIASLPAPR